MVNQIAWHSTMMLLGASSEVSRILFDNCEASFGELNPKRLIVPNFILIPLL